MSGTQVTANEVGEDPSRAQSVTIENNYVVIVDGSAFAASTQVHANGTHVITVKGVR